MKVLVVEDDFNVAQSIQHLLSHYHYAVDIVADAETALEMAEAFEYDLALVDILLPGMDGLSLCQQLRQAGQQMPILLLTGQESAGPQKAAALNVGADDYVAKPFDAEELVARVQALLRRSGADARPILTWGALSVEPSSRRVTYRASLLLPTPKEYAILELMLRQAQTTFSAADILNRVWDSAESPGEEVVRYHIKELRQKLTAAGAPKDFIQTVHGVGYRLNPLYSEALVKQVEQSGDLPQVAELTAVNEQLRQAYEELQIQSEELRSQFEELLATRQALEQERQRYRDLFENAPDGYLITNSKGMIQSANLVAADLLATSVDMLIGKPLANFIDIEDRRNFRTCLSQHHWPQPWEIRIHPFKQTPFPALITVIPKYDDQQRIQEICWMVRDIRDRKQLEQQLVAANAALERRVAAGAADLFEREAFLSSIFEGAAQAIFVVEVTEEGDFRFVDFNQAALETSGKRLEEVQGKTPEAAFGEEVGNDFRQHYQDCVDAGHSIAYEEHFELDDRILWTITTLSPIRNEAGEIHRLVGTVIDISDRKQTELQLQAQSAALSNAVEGISQLDAQGRYTYVNEAYARLVGYTPPELIGLHWEGTVHPDDHPLLKSAFRKMLKRGKAEVEARGIRKDGSIFYKQATLVACFDDQQQYSGHYCFAKDVSDRKQLELALRTSEAQLSRIFDSAVAAISEFYAYPDGSYTHTFMSAGCATVYGYSQQAMLENDDLWASRVLPEDMEAVILGAFDRIYAEETFTVEYRFLDPDDQVRWIAETLISRRDAAFDRWTVTTVAVNISDRKQAEMALQKQIRQEYLLADIAQDIRRSLNLEEVLSRTVHRIRDFLATDRVIIFRFRPDWQGDVIEESVGSGWSSILSTTIYDPCFEEQYIEPYRQGRISAMVNIDEDDLQPCYVELLKPFEVKANLVVPIMLGETLWGLLIAHHCVAPRQWQPSETAVLRRLAVQVGIAIQQSELYEQTRRELLARQRMQTVLEESEERFRTLSAAAPVGILQTNADGICLYTNDYWQKMSGLSLEESLGAGWQQAIHPGDRDLVQRVWEEHLHRRQECQSEFRLLTSKGETRWVTARAAAIKSSADEVVGNVCILADITAQKQAAQKIEEQAALLDIAPDAIFVCDLDDQILYWNKGAENLYGWTAQEAEGQKAHELLQEDPDQLASIIPALFERGEWQGEMAKVTKTGERGIVESRWTLVRDDAGVPKYVLNVNTDVTLQKNLEAQIYQAQKLESLGQLASGIAHDLNNVFTPILTVAQVLRLKGSELDEKSQQLLRILEDSAKRGANMVQQILSVTRRGPGEREILNPIEVLAEVASIAEESFPKTISIACDFAQLNGQGRAQQLVSVDPTQLHQILMNLVVNARDAMPDGGTLTLSAQTTFVDNAIAQEILDAQVGEYWLISVADTGVGIEPETRDRMFDPFYTTKEPGKGTGLGLSTVLSLIKNADGFLQVLSEVGEGTTMEVFLPITSDSVAESPPPSTNGTQSPRSPLPSHGDYILIVDDDDTVLQTTQSLLENHHYDTLIAKDGPAAIALYTQHRDRIRLVILDITMPIMSGIEVIERLRALDASIRIIAISGLPTNREPAVAVGADVFLDKPYSLETLLSEVEAQMQ